MYRNYLSNILTTVLAEGMEDVDGEVCRIYISISTLPVYLEITL